MGDKLSSQPAAISSPRWTPPINSINKCVDSNIKLRKKNSICDHYKKNFSERANTSNTRTGKLLRT